MPNPDIVFQDDWTTVICGDVMEVLGKNAFVPISSIDMAMTSVPYLRQRRYSADGAFGWEESVKEWLDHMDAFAKKVEMVLRPHGTFWLNSGDKWGGSSSGSDYGDKRFNYAPEDYEKVKSTKLKADRINRKGNLMMLPERMVIRLTDEGIFTLINKCIWHKPNRAVQSYGRKLVDTWEPVYLLAKDESKYRWNRKAIGVQQRGDMADLSLEPEEPEEDEGFAEQMDFSLPGVERRQFDEDRPPPHGTPEYAMWYAATRRKQSWHDHKDDDVNGQHRTKGMGQVLKHPDGSNPGDVWSISIKTDPFFGHNGIPAQRIWPSWPIDLCTLPILATTEPGDTVLDPFCGSGSLGVAAKLLGRRSILVDIDRDSCRIAAVRVMKAATPLDQGKEVKLL